jgi:hypothetical protein
MLFCSEKFLVFFTIVFIAYWALPWPRVRVWLLLGASFYFYASWNKWLALIICVSTAMDYFIARGMEAWSSTRGRRLLVTPELHERWLQRTRDEYTPILVNFRIAPEADRLFREMLHTCRHEGIQVIGLLRMPEGTEFKRLYSPEATQCIDSYLHDLCRQEETRLIDASNWLEDDCFADGHHLLPPGAKRFTLRLWREVLEPAVEGQMSSCDVGRAPE